MRPEFVERVIKEKKQHLVLIIKLDKALGQKTIVSKHQARSLIGFYKLQSFK
jgi:hypothetical protein